MKKVGYFNFFLFEVLNNQSNIKQDGEKDNRLQTRNKISYIQKISNRK